MSCVVVAFWTSLTTVSISCVSFDFCEFLDGVSSWVVSTLVSSWVGSSWVVSTLASSWVGFL